MIVPVARDVRARREPPWRPPDAVWRCRRRRGRRCDFCGATIAAGHLAFHWRQRGAACARCAVGGGECGPAPSSIITSASLQLMASRVLFDLGTLSQDPKLLVLGSKLANDSRQNLLAAHELSAREAQARQADEGDELRRQQRAFQARLVAQQAKGDSNP